MKVCDSPGFKQLEKVRQSGFHCRESFGGSISERWPSFKWELNMDKIVASSTKQEPAVSSSAASSSVSGGAEKGVQQQFLIKNRKNLNFQFEFTCLLIL